MTTGKDTQEETVKELPLEVYHRFELFWYEPEVTEILEDLFSGESEEVHKLTDRMLSLEGEDWRVAIVPKDKPPLLSQEDCHQVDNPSDYNMGAEAQRDADIRHYEGGKQ